MLDAGSKEINIAEADLPRCQLCGALARPGVVWFDEKPYKLDEINSLVTRPTCALLLVPPQQCVLLCNSAWIMGSFLREGTPGVNVCIPCPTSRGESSRVNLEPSEGEDRADFVFRGPCEVQLLRVFPELGAS